MTSTSHLKQIKLLVKENILMEYSLEDIEDKQEVSSHIFPRFQLIYQLFKSFRRLNPRIISTIVSYMLVNNLDCSHMKKSSTCVRLSSQGTYPRKISSI